MWAVLYLDEALRAWERATSHHDPSWIKSMALDWKQRRQEFGPPSDAIQLYPDFEMYIVRLPRTDLWIKYLLVEDERERIIIVKEMMKQ